MKQCIAFPEDRFLAVRPCLVAICGDNRPAGKLLGILLYRYNLRVENRDDAQTQNEIKVSQGQIPDQDISFSIYRKQWQLVEDLCDELSEKTIHNTAIPWLQLLGYLDIEEFQGGNRYDVNLEQVKQALSLYIPGKKEQPQLEKFLIAHLQLEKFLIDIQLEKFPIDKKSFLLLLEKVLIANRKVSYCQRGRKPKPKADSDSEMEDPQNLEEDSKKSKEEKGEGATSLQEDRIAPTNISLFVEERQRRETNPRLPVLTVEPKGHLEHSCGPDCPICQTSSTRVDAATPVQHSVPPGLLPPPGAGAAQGDTCPPMPHRPLTAKEIGVQIEKRKEQILELYGQKIGRKPTRSKANLDGALKLAQDEVSDEDISTTIDAILADSFLVKNLNVTFVHSHVDALAKKPIPLHQSNGANGSPQAEPVIPRGAVRAARERLEARVAREKRMAL